MYNFSNSNQNDCKHLNDEQTEMCLISKCRTVGQVDAPEMNTHRPSGTDTYAYIRYKIEEMHRAVRIGVKKQEQGETAVVEKEINHSNG